jgi:hypothetical protein
LFATAVANGHEKNPQVLRIVEPRSGETGEELIRVLRVVLARPIPKWTNFLPLLRLLPVIIVVFNTIKIREI